jgi:hypothetical protein
MKYQKGYHQLQREKHIARLKKDLLFVFGILGFLGILGLAGFFSKR